MRSYVKELMADAGLVVRWVIAAREALSPLLVARLAVPAIFTTRRLLHSFSDATRSPVFVREDAVGNIFGRWEGRKQEAVLTGSHCDAIPLAGKQGRTAAKDK
jgi:acetylornithine deacetylase/succinyl-diaminopimelate desuccinylase-like protein